MPKYGSKYLMRANPALTTNVKLMVDSEYNLYLESYDSNDTLSDSKYKRYKIIPDSYLSERLARFYKGLPADLAFEVRNIISTDKVQFDYENQYDDIYYSGARNVENKKYIEEFQYNTTLKIDDNKLPKYFFIFRLDGTGVNTNNLHGGNIGESSIMNDLKNSKLIHTTDMNGHTNLGKFLVKNYVDEEIPSAPFELNLNRFEFSRWHGYNYETGGVIQRSMYIDDFMRTQLNDFDFEKFITEGFRDKEVICSNYLNISHLFDDTVANTFVDKKITDDIKTDKWYKLKDYPFIYDMFNKNQLNISQFNFKQDNDDIVFHVKNDISYRDKWRINRYMGFYADELKEITKISPYVTTDIINDNPNIYIVDNKFVDISITDPNVDNSINPLKYDYNENNPIYLKINETFYLIERTKEEINGVYEYTDSYHIVSDEVINGQLMDILSKSTKPIKIVYDEFVEDNGHRNYIINADYSDFNNFLLDNYTGINIIKIYDKFYTISYDTVADKYYINTDEIINCDNTRYVSELIDEKFIKSTKVSSKDSDIPYYSIYAIKFTDIEDFDFTHLYTTHANYEYEKTILTNNKNITDIDNSLQYRDYEIKRPIFFEYDYKTYPKSPKIFDNYRYRLSDGTNDVRLFVNDTILPQSSEYSANGDLYMIKGIDVSEIWNINQHVNKFVFLGSNDINSVQYKLNNSYDVWGQTNKGFDIRENSISIMAHNLDWFYTFGTPFKSNNGVSVNKEPISVSTHINNLHRYKYEYFRTLNIDLDKISDNEHYRIGRLEFNYDDYLNNPNFDYLSYFMLRPMRLNIDDENTIIKNVDRFSIMNDTDGSNGSLFYYKGLTGYIRYNTLSDNTDYNSESISYLADDLDDYKMTAIFTRRETNDETKIGKSGIDFVLNKHHRHLLICVYIFVGYGELTEFEYMERDYFYDNDDTVKYTVDDIDSVFVESKLRYSDLTVRNIFNIMNDNLHSKDPFDEINYILLEDKNEYVVKYISGNIVEFDKETEFRKDDIISINGNYYTILDEVNNHTLELDNSMSISVGDIMTKADSVKPFIFDMREYIDFVINDEINEVVTRNSKVKSRNELNTLNNSGEDIEIRIEDNIIPTIIKDSENDVFEIKRHSSKINDDDRKEIFRYNGLYEPNLNSLNIFHNYELRLSDLLDLNGLEFNITQENIDNITTDVAYFVGNVTTVDYINIDTFMKYHNEFSIYIPNKLAKSEYGNYLSTIKEVIFDEVNNILKIYLDNVRDISVSEVMDDVKLLLNYDSNYEFNFDYHNFGIISEQIISKVDRGMKVSKDIRLIYPRIDEHGVTAVDRNIFLSNWNNSFFYDKDKNDYDLI